jgi:hypothetical protein
LSLNYRGSPGRTAAKTTYHPYFFKDPSKFQVAVDKHLKENGINWREEKK